MFTVLWTLDWAWANTQAQLRRDSDWLRLPRPVVHTSIRELLRNWFRYASVMFWKKRRAVRGSVMASMSTARSPQRSAARASGSGD